MFKLTMKYYVAIQEMYICSINLNISISKADEDSSSIHAVLTSHISIDITILLKVNSIAPRAHIHAYRCNPRWTPY